MSANTGLLEMDNAAKAFVDFLEAEGYIGPTVDTTQISKHPKKHNSTLDVEKVREAALARNWIEIEVKEKEKSYDLLRFQKEEGKWLINIYCSTGAVQTTLNHPTKARNQLDRNVRTLEELIPILDNPRVHTDRGYRKAVDHPMSVNKQRDLYNLLFKPSYAGKTFSFHDVHKYMLAHNLLRLEGNKWVFPTKGLTVLSNSKSPKRNKEPQRRRIAIDQRLAIRNTTKKLKTRKGEPLSFLAANIGIYEVNAGLLLETIKWPSVVFLSNTKLDSDVDDEDLVWSGYHSCRKSGAGENGDLLLYYLSHLQMDSLDDLHSDKLDVLWVKITDHKVLLGDRGKKKDRVTILGNVSGGKHGQAQLLQHLQHCLANIKDKFGDVDIVMQGEGVNEEGLRKLERLGMENRNGGNMSQFFLTSGGMPVQSVQAVLEYQGNTVHKPVLAQMEKTRCVICQVEFRKSKELKDHQDSVRHHRNHCFNLYQRRRQEMMKSPHHLGLEISIVNANSCVAMSPDEPGLVVVRTAPDTVVNFTVLLKNLLGPNDKLEDSEDPAGIVVQAIDFLKVDPAFKITDKHELSNREKTQRKKIRIPCYPESPKKGYEAKITCQAKQRGHTKIPLVVTFYHDLKSNFIMDQRIEGETIYLEKRFELSHMALEVLLMVQTDDMRELKPKAPYKKAKPIAKWTLKDTEKAPPPPRIEDIPQEERLAGKVKLEHYPINSHRYSVLTHGMEIWEGASQADRDQKSRCDRALSGGLSPQNYKDRLELLLHCEEHQLQYDIHHYDMTAVELAKRNQLMELKVPGLAENRPSVLKGDKLFIRQCTGEHEFEGIVYEVGENEVRLGCSDRLVRNHMKGMKYDIRFTLNRFPLRNMHRAVSMAESEGIIPVLFPTTQHFKNNVKLPDIKPMDRLLADNAEQMLAVQHIVAGTSGAVPYLVFGPPGTGKTVTMVEAVKQIHRMDPKSHILATAPSNAAADLLASRLIKHIPPSQLLRLHAPSRITSSIPEDVLAVSNLNRSSGSFSYPTVEVLAKYRVLVVTLVTAGRLVSGSFPSGHFSHVFIDEAGHAMEPEAVIALAGILTRESVNSRKSSIVLAGDPKQLGPVLRSPWAIKHGLGVSLLERLMNEAMYAKGDGGYDHRCITKLVRNFRSHEKLLRLPARLFYNGELEAAADEMVVNSLLKWPGLPKPGFPMLFHGIVGQDLREERSPSFFNLEEVCTVVEYIEDLLSTREFGIRVQQKEIGVISPYRRQVQKIREKLKSKQLADITVGSTEEFQGQERRVMIVSTVRSSPEYFKEDVKFRLGFLRNPKRFNVAITRAKALLIVVGNPHILSQDNDWKALIEYAMEEGGYVGCPYAEEDDDAINAMAVRMANILNIQDSQISHQTALEEPQWKSDY